MISFLPLQQCSAYIVHLTWIVLEIGDRGPYNCCFMKSYFQDLLNTACNILLRLPSTLFHICFISIHVVHPYSRIDTTAIWKKSGFVLSDWLDNQSIAVLTFARHILMSFSVDETLLLRYLNLFKILENFCLEWRCLLIKTFVFCFVCIYVETNAISCLLQTM